ncbi:MAG TPA: metallophosphoesterase [Gemmatimonadota bacterium]|nr:metallophosphoesterase [Gemmatimonadota bacterium]
MDPMRVPAWLLERLVPVILAALACSGSSVSDPNEPGPDPNGGTLPEAVLVGAGDIANCFVETDEATAKLLDGIDGTVVTLGDNAYESGTREEFANCYEPTWGRHKARTRPILGNHDVRTENAAPYFEYFGARAGSPGLGYYSYDLGSWHIIALNSNIDVGSDSPQAHWLRADLAANPTECALAYWHHPRFSSGEKGNFRRMRPFWAILDSANVDVLLQAHDHDYERFAPLDADGNPDPNGLRSFVVGTGGDTLDPFVDIKPHSEVRNAQTHGVLKLELFRGRYEWDFVPIAGGNFSDGGRGDCIP